MNELKYEYLIVCLLDPLLEGSEFIGWPLHITLIPTWIRTTKSQENIIKDIKKVVTEFKPFTVRGSLRTHFGWRESLPVTAVVSTELHDLHRALLAMLESYGYDLVQTNHIGTDYQPHVTKKGSAELKPNHEVLVDRIYLVRAPISNPRTRIKTVRAVLELN